MCAFYFYELFTGAEDDFVFEVTTFAIPFPEMVDSFVAVVAFVAHFTSCWHPQSSNPLF